MSWIVRPVEQKRKWAVQYLQELVRATCLRRTKQKALQSGTLQLPPRFERIQSVRLHPDDQALYDSVKKASQKLAAKFNKQPQSDSSTRDKDKNVVLLLNSLRLICNHGRELIPASLREMIEKGSLSYTTPEQRIHDRECSACGGEPDESKFFNVDQVLLCQNCATSEEGVFNSRMNLDGVQGESWSTPQSTISGRSGPRKVVQRHSAKVLALLANLKRESSIRALGYKQRKRQVLELPIC